MTGLMRLYIKAILVNTRIRSRSHINKFYLALRSLAFDNITPRNSMLLQMLQIIARIPKGMSVSMVKDVLMHFQNAQHIDTIELCYEKKIEAFSSSTKTKIKFT